MEGEKPYPTRPTTKPQKLKRQSICNFNFFSAISQLCADPVIGLGGSLDPTLRGLVAIALNLHNLQCCLRTLVLSRGQNVRHCRCKSIVFSTTSLFLLNKAEINNLLH